MVFVVIGDDSVSLIEFDEYAEIVEKVEVKNITKRNRIIEAVLPSILDFI